MSETPAAERPIAGATARWTLLVGLGSGILAGLLGIGGGSFTVFGLVAVAALSQHRAHATSLAAIPLVALAGALVFGSSGNVDLRAAAFLIAGSWVGALLGARIMASMSDMLLRRAFGLMMLAIGIRLLL